MPVIHHSTVEPALSDERTWALIGPLRELALKHRVLEAGVVGWVGHGDSQLPIPRFVFRGPSSGVEPLRLAVFTLVHGDEPAGADALFQLLVEAVTQPDLLRGIDLYGYPVCNPTGYEDGTRFSRAGVDLNREFWSGSSHVEVQVLEGELLRHRFDGLVALHADCDSPGVYAYARGPVISEEILAPALAEAERVFPRNCASTIDGFAASRGVIRDCFPGVLAAPPHRSPAPFEIILETPGQALVCEQARAACLSLRGIIAGMPRLYMGGADI